MYSPWQRRFPTPDPLIVYGQEYPELSTYQFASNSPIMNIDLDGLEGTSALINEEFTGSIYGSRVVVGDVMEKKILADACGIVGGVIFTVYGGPAGWILGPTSVGLSTAKLIGHLNQESFNQSKVDKVPSSFTGAFMGATNEAIGGDFVRGALCGDILQGFFELKKGYPINNNLDLLGVSTTSFSIINPAGQLLNSFKESEKSPVDELNVSLPQNIPSCNKKTQKTENKKPTSPMKFEFIKELNSENNEIVIPLK
jgi:hypothetical protein